MSGRYILLYIFLFTALLYSSCKKNIDYDTSDKLSFSTDTLKFDTVFTTIGSATHNFLIRNTNPKPLKLNHVRLAGGSSSHFRINVDGRATTDYQNFTIAAHDSAFIFVEVTVDPNSSTTPFIITDSVLFENNTGRQRVILEAYGQNAHFLTDSVINYNVTWTNTLPYVINRSILVDAGHTLTIQPGTKIYSHKNSYIYIQGSLNIQGTESNPVILRTDRLEDRYKDDPGQWMGIRLLPKSVSFISHAIINNAVNGIEVDSVPLNSGQLTLTIEKTEIKNASSVGIIAYTGSVSARNLLIHDCMQGDFAGTFGGIYQFANCTFEDHNSGSTAYPCVSLDNQPFPTKPVATAFPLKASFYQCIMWANLDDAVYYKAYSTSSFDTTFSTNLIKATQRTFNNSNLINKYPMFNDVYANKYDLEDGSPAINAGTPLTGTLFVKDDITDFTRDAKPDIGCYEKH